MPVFHTSKLGPATSMPPSRAISLTLSSPYVELRVVDRQEKVALGQVGRVLKWFY